MINNSYTCSVERQHLLSVLILLFAALLTTKPYFCSVVFGQLSQLTEAEIVEVKGLVSKLRDTQALLRACNRAWIDGGLQPDVPLLHTELGAANTMRLLTLLSKPIRMAVHNSVISYAEGRKLYWLSLYLKSYLYQLKFLQHVLGEYLLKTA